LIETIKQIVGFGCLAFSIIGFLEQLLQLAFTKSYNLLRAVVYSLLLGIALALI